MTEQTEQRYYIAQAATLLKNHTRLIAAGGELLRARYGDALAAALIAESTAEFEELIPAIPYIGGKANPLTDTLVQMTSLLALYRAMQRYDKPVEEIGELVYQLAQARIEQYPRFVRALLGRLYMSRYWRRRTQQHAARSQERRYPGDFVYEIVEGGADFDWGINYLQCGVVSFFHQQQADAFTPYMCLIDYLIFPGMGVGLQRRGTIGHGCSHCDFRFKRGGSTPPAWPPSFSQPPERET